MGRSCCGTCERPVSRCLCSQLPVPPLRTRTRIIVLQHPHEARHKLSTLPVLRRCLSDCHLLVGRRFQPGSSPLLDSASNASNPDSRPLALLLFPTPPAHPIGDWFALHKSLGCPSCQLVESGSSNSWILPTSGRDTIGIPSPTAAEDSAAHLILIVVDATWQHAREMMKASACFLDKFAVPVCLPFDVNREGCGMANSDLILRKEPFAGCVSTMEAVASCLKVLEPDGTEIEQKLISVLRSMVQFQASHISTHKIRSRESKERQ